MTLTEDELRAVLRAQVRAHRPDRAAILDRVTGTATRDRAARRRAPRVRIAGATAAVAAVIGGGGFAQWALAGGTGPDRPAPPPPSSFPTVPPSSPPPRPSHQPGRPASAAPAATPVLRAAGTVEVGGRTRASGVVTIRATGRLTALRVTIRVAKTPGLVARDGSQQVPGASVTSDVTEEAGAVVYHFTLSSKDTLGPGTYTFFARYTFPAGGRDAGADTYSADATGGSGTSVRVSGTFG
ncbi:hypothetical protein ACWT_0287 [Actinoplanes sp. SE50]|uniref:hypothetical protein n=1 Tax=unclassified Actinoplanes TaxID=2626549 RepID=UPI00023EC00E|nr:MULTISPECIES: hypothetical protein [unclassified Actinoplanes]AEV81299.1 hypothetical protein ACPL_402 [Actinoplanes sp. SE50/110]ATO79702.1 hypothetical protein ACWT_0287 [Actinoplanes sp. SE50]SLL97105.1 hypothetical protein ACSP50_0301 [Actinoplanes sp. SE50/110]